MKYRSDWTCTTRRYVRFGDTWVCAESVDAVRPGAIAERRSTIILASGATVVVDELPSNIMRRLVKAMDAGDDER